MDRIVEQYTEKVELVLNDGSRSPADLNIEVREEASRAFYAVTLELNGKTVAGQSKEGLFDALRKLRMTLEKDKVLLHCFGASENVYPSGMQVSFGGTKAYRMRLGAPALLKDIVDIFASDDSVRPSTVEQQEKFRERWLASLTAGLSLE